MAIRLPAKQTLSLYSNDAGDGPRLFLNGRAKLMSDSRSSMIVYWKFATNSIDFLLHKHGPYARQTYSDTSGSLIGSTRHELTVTLLMPRVNPLIFMRRGYVYFKYAALAITNVGF